MAIEKNQAGQGTVATVVATAAVTLAIGVTAAAFGGYLVPGRTNDKADVVEVAQRSEPAVAETLPAPPTSPPNVVLVPIAPDRTKEPSLTPPPPPLPEAVLAVYDAHEDDDDDHHRRRHHEREEEEDHHDDDD